MKDAGIKILNNDVQILSEITLIDRTDDTHNIRSKITDILPKADIDKPIVVWDHILILFQCTKDKVCF